MIDNILNTKDRDRLIDKVTIERIKKLHPMLVDEAGKIYNECLERNIPIRFTSTLRSKEEQDCLYMQGRFSLEQVNAARKTVNMYILGSDENKIVTFARGNQSFHNFGVAIDFCLLINGHEYDMRYDNNRNGSPDWDEVVYIFTKLFNWQWGATVNFPGDTPHFQKTFGYTLKQMQDVYNMGKIDTNGYIKFI